MKIQQEEDKKKTANFIGIRESDIKTVFLKLKIVNINSY